MYSVLDSSMVRRTKLCKKDLRVISRYKKNNMDDVAYSQYHWECRRFKSSPENRSLEESKSGGAQSWKKFVQKLGEERAAAGARLQVQVRY